MAEIAWPIFVDVKDDPGYAEVMQDLIVLLVMPDQLADSGSHMLEGEPTQCHSVQPCTWRQGDLPEMMDWLVRNHTGDEVQQEMREAYKRMALVPEQYVGGPIGSPPEET